MTNLVFTLVVTDGTTLRTLFAPRLGPTRTAVIESVIRDVLAEEADPPVVCAEPAGAALRSQREIAASQGFTGDPCPNCASFQMVRTGTCVTCQECSHNAGCG